MRGRRGAEAGLVGVELFAGAGGLALGVAAAGVRHVAVVERDRHACETFRRNAAEGWPLFEGDARLFDYAPFAGVDLVSGGPPCQPFSIGGKHGASADERDMFPEAARAVRETRPLAFVFENVRGLLRRTFSDYFAHVVAQLECPSVRRLEGEDWAAHGVRIAAARAASGPEYAVAWRLFDAADYGVPQRRHRVAIVGYRADLGFAWAPPPPTHSEDALLYAKWCDGSYWDRHGVGQPGREALPSRLAGRVAALRGLGKPVLAPWATVRDALAGMPAPSVGGGGGFQNHVLNPGARAYPGHTGSPLDAPSKALKAGAHGVPGGENMLVGADGGVRYFTVREAARLQTFPDGHAFHGAWSECMRQVGNAVPVLLARRIAESVVAPLLESRGNS